MEANKSYILKLYGSRSKFQDLEWSAFQYKKLTNSFIYNLYFNPQIKFFSTKGLGLIGNQAQRKALGIVKSKRSGEKENSQKMVVPTLKNQLCFANIRRVSSSAHFNYIVNFSCSFAGDKRATTRYLFAKGTKPLKEALNKGWIISDQCEPFFETRDNCWYVQVFLYKEVKQAIPKNKSIGIDVGVNHIIATSEGYLGNSMSKRIKRLNKSKKEAARQLTIAKNKKDKVRIDALSKNLTKNRKINKTIIKQLLDKEAKRLIARGLVISSNLVVEDPKVLSNLSSPKGLGRWAKTYFAYRLQVLGKENGIFVVMVHPAYTSITCPKCGSKDKENRNKLSFNCIKCGHSDHADVNGSINLSRKGQEQVDKYIIPSLLKKLKSNSVKAL